MQLPALRHLDLGELRLTSGGALRSARMTYRVWGTLNPDGRNAVLLPSHYTGSSASSAGIIGPDRALDPQKWYIIAPDLFGNGLATSPSHLSQASDRLAFPTVSVIDNVRAQKILLDSLGVHALALVQGWSMGAIQAWHWAAMYPEMTRAILPVCGASGCWPLNRVFLSGLQACLVADPEFRAGHPHPQGALRAFARVYAGWAYSDRFWREEGWRELGFDSAEALLTWWEDDHLAWDAHDLAAVLETWSDASLARAASPAGDIPTALKQVRARVIAMPCDTDRYFTVAENEFEVSHAHRAELRVIASHLGHVAGAPGRHVAETALVELATADLLAD